MTTAALLSVARGGGSQARRRALLASRLPPAPAPGPRWGSTSRRRPASGPPDPPPARPSAAWDAFGAWDNRLDEPILLPPSIHYGHPIPSLSLRNVGCASQIGKRRENEDRYGRARLGDRLLYFAVYDGHGGPAAADFCNTHMEKHILDFLAKDEDLEAALTRAFLDIDRAFAQSTRLAADGAGQTSGTTATVALLRDGIELVVGSVGDSRALLCRAGKPLKLTTDHTPERKDEKARIKRSGGFVAWNSLGQPLVNGRLAMTRSIGDLDLKASGVIAEPETKRIMLNHGDDGFLVLTTDGINFTVNSQEICDCVSQAPSPADAARVLTDQAIQFGAEDNSTAVVVPFGAWGKYKASDVGFSFSRGFASRGRWA
ncbi:protein phosphatase 1K, mitochondrial [Tachyglossus aculeatus]|uniref:protein phosphatase 1K, mitochondrial n=1 Tax=Tachyglossus aculeatus TaxID=9261 RepID=UPI0018F418F9|nr:protein phosphatase 1K, mitochondrial [Tachyglossus aculeatus]XP_038604167.1 protein phosphatase 1K, mitochondrial [Tachyglossus aculeatus]XP_038604168.1 protein phosphatase 1K, mitochondrial [Tachyglossus aculeatus]